VRRRLWWVISAAVLVAAIVGTYLGVKAASSDSDASSPATTAELLTVVACPSGHGISGFQAPRYPAAISTVLEAGQVGKFALYSDSYRTVQPVLGPQGWDCSVDEAVDGGLSVDIFPPGQSAQGPDLINAYSEPACVGCIYTEVCPLIPYVTRIMSSYDFPCPASRPPGEAVTWLSGPRAYTTSGADIIGFTDPPGVHGNGAGSGGRYPSRGILRFSWSPVGSPSSSVVTCTVAPAYESACSVILGLAAKQRWG
jgi:hypothetical protein